VIRCPDCGATNADSASWCGQCFASLGAAAEGAAPAVEEGAAPAVEEGAAPAVEEGAAPAVGGGGGDEDGAGLRRGAAGLEWACVACGIYNPIEVSACTVCGTSFTARFTAEEEPVDWERAWRKSLVLPGLGHLDAGRGGSGVGRAVLFVVWLVGGLLTLVGAGAAGMVLATPLFAGAGVVYGVTLVDIRRLEAGRDELLVGRTLLWLVVAVTALLVVSTIAATGAGSPPPTGSG
jgi:hypothetical protein